VRAPGFWTRPPGLASALLAPVAGLWTAVTRNRLRRPGLDLPVPVVCVGNLVAGGAGKTPVVADLAARLGARGIAVVTLSRGHGGTLPGPLAVDPARHGAGDVGDEPLLLALGGTTAWIARDRAAGALAAVAAGAGVVILDDGFQNPALVKQLSLLVVDGTVGFGNGRVMPAGPLREPVADGLARADAVVLMGEDRAGVAALIGARLPLLRARLVPDPAAAAALAGRRVLAFAGIGRPEKFFETCRAVCAAGGGHVAATVPFPDHHPYTGAEIDRILTRAAALGAMPVTTAKDAVRLPPGVRDRVAVLTVRLAWDDPARLDRLLDPHFPDPDPDHGQA
jgi:tetraacyldisaccharide 4'-kinase